MKSLVCSVFKSEKSYIKKRAAIAFLFFLLNVFFLNRALAQTNTWDGSTNNNWGTAANWSLNLVPIAAHNVVIDNTTTNTTITVNVATAFCNNFTITNRDNAVTVNVGANSLTMTGTVSIGAGSGTGDHLLLAVGAGSLSCTSITVAATGNPDRNSGVTLTSGSITSTGNITMGANDVFTFTGAGTLNVGGNITGGTFTTFAGSTVNYNGGVAQAVRDVSYLGNLTLSGSNTKTWTLGGARTIGGILTVSSGSTFATVNNSTLNVTGTTGVAGTLNLGGIGLKTFTGAVTVGGTWNLSADPTSFAGGITMNGTTFNNGTGATAFTANQSLLGSNAMTFGGIVTISAGTTLTNSNTNIVTLSNTGVGLAVGGAGSTFTQGTTGNTLSYAGSSLDVTAFNANGAGNTVNYSGATQAVRDVAYVNLTTSGTNTKTWTLGGARTISGILTVSSGSTFATGNNASTLNVTGTTGVTGTLNLGGTGLKTFTGAVTVNIGGVWDLTGAVQPTSFAGGITMSGTTFNNGTGATAFTANQSLLGSSAMTFGGIVTISAGTTLTNSNTNIVTLSNTGVGLAVGGAGSTFTQGTTGNTLSYAGSSLDVTAFNANGAGNTVNYSGATQAVRDVAYVNLTTSGTNTKTWTLGGARTISGILTVSSGSTFATGNNASTLNITGTTGVTGTLNLGGTGLKTFTGAVTVNVGGVWNLSAAVQPTSFAGGITMNGTTFNNGTGAAAFTTTQSLLGSSNMTFGGTIVPTGGTTLTNSNTGTVTVSSTGSITLTGNVTQGAGSTLALAAAAPFSGLGTFNASTNANTVDYTGAAQAVRTATYRNLSLSGSGSKTFGGVTTISGNLSISGTAVANLGVGLTHAATTITLGGVSQPSGSHGSTTSTATYQNNTYFSNTGIVNVACSVTTTGTATTYYSRNTGNWNDNNSWTTNADGTGGPLAAGVWPRIFDNVVIRSGNTITIDAVDDNEFCGITPDGLGRSNVGPFAASNVLMFYQTGDLLIDGALSVSVEIMIENYTHVTSTGNFTSSTTLVNLGNLEVDNGATFSTLDDLILAGTSTTIVNTNSIAADDLIISFTSATLCGTGATTLQNGSGSVITYANGATPAQICSTYTVNCTGSGCAVTFPVVGPTVVIIGNTGPGGVGNSTNNKLWLRANDLSLANGAAVASWADISGNGLIAANASATERPTFATNSANGFPSLAFDGTADNLSLGAPAALNFVPQTHSWSFIIAYRSPANGPAAGQTPNQGTLFSKAWNTTNRNYQYQVDNIGATTNSALQSYIGNSLTTTGTVIVNTNAWVISSHTNTTTTRSSFSNEAANFTGEAIAAGADPLSEVLVGARRDTGPANGTEGFFYAGDIAEIMMYNSVVNDAQRIIIADYLAAKYAVTLSANDFYTMDDGGNGNFDYEVAGIGQASDGSNHKDAMGTGVVRMWNPNGLANGEFLLWGHDNATLASSTAVGVGAPVQERLARTWRVSELGGDVGTVSISFDISALSGAPLGSNLRLLIDRNNNGFTDNDVAPIAGTFVDNVIVFSGVNFQDDDKFTLGNTDITKPLPIELIGFSAKLNNDIVELKWSTATELNNDFFTLERAFNIEEFEAFGDPIDGKGTTSERSNYTAFDESPIYGRSYYRLKQTDFDGAFTYSPVKTIDYDGPKFSVLKVYPNPSGRHMITIEVDGLKDQPTVPVQIFNVQGQKVFDQVLDVTTPGTLKKDLEFSTPLKQGLYIIKAGQTLQLTQKLIVD